MKPIYLLLLLFMAIGLFACTEDPTQVATELAPQPEGKILDANSFAEFTNNLVDFGLFEEDNFTDLEDFGSEDVRLYRNEAGELEVDFLTNDGFSGGMSVDEVIAHHPARNWEKVIELSIDKAEAPRLSNWFTANFSGVSQVDLRVSFLVNGTIVISGLKPTADDLVEFGAVPFF